MRTVRTIADFIAIIGLGLVLMVIVWSRASDPATGSRKQPMNPRSFTGPTTAASEETTHARVAEAGLL